MSTPPDDTTPTAEPVSLRSSTDVTQRTPMPAMLPTIGTTIVVVSISCARAASAASTTTIPKRRLTFR